MHCVCALIIRSEVDLDLTLSEHLCDARVRDEDLVHFAIDLFVVLGALVHAAPETQAKWEALVAAL
mgnify:CR=1 FL=1